MSLTQSIYVPLAVSAGSSGASSAINCKAYTTGVIEVSGISGDTVLLQTRLNPGGGWYTHGVTNASGSTVSASILTDGLYQFNIAGIAEVRSSWTWSAGDLNIGIRLSDQ